MFPQNFISDMSIFLLHVSILVATKMNKDNVWDKP